MMSRIASGPVQPKTPVYRNPALLKAVRGMPHCSLCGKHNDGTIVAAHSNQLAHGKGRGIKASDREVCSACFTCHMELDQGNRLSKEEKREWWNAGHRRTADWLVDVGFWPSDP